MKPQKVILADLDEMLFEHRDKTYGAYVLRKSYPWYLITALTAVCHVFLLVVCWPVISHHIDANGLDKWNIKQPVDQAYNVINPWEYFEPVSLQQRSDRHIQLQLRFPPYHSIGNDHIDELPLALNLSQVQHEMNDIATKQLGHLHGHALVRVWVSDQGVYRAHKVRFFKDKRLLSVISSQIHKLKFVPARKAYKAVDAYVDVLLMIGNEHSSMR